jgi:uncharacterized protein (DUF111 family)
MTITAIGYGAGDRDLEEQANLLRLLVGEADDRSLSDQAWMLETNLDDISGEVIAHATTLLADAGALDVYTTAIQMKKNRPAVKISVLSPPELIKKLEKILFRETGTLGVRRWPVSRHKLERRQHTVQTPFGPVEGKLAVLGDGGVCFSPEFESCRRLAAEKNAPLKDIYDAARTAWSGGQG